MTCALMGPLLWATEPPCQGEGLRKAVGGPTLNSPLRGHLPPEPPWGVVSVPVLQCHCCARSWEVAPSPQHFQPTPCRRQSQSWEKQENRPQGTSAAD